MSSVPSVTKDVILKELHGRSLNNTNEVMKSFNIPWSQLILVPPAVLRATWYGLF